MQLLVASPDQVEFILHNANVAFSNALRRALLGWVPTMAIERVYISRNDSLVPDEMLAHRLGMVPIRADARRFQFRAGDQYTDADTIVLRCSVMGPSVPREKRTVVSGDLIWEPQGDQVEIADSLGIRPAILDIPLTVLREREALELVAYCEKGIGLDHAKWSPVATAYYHFSPTISVGHPDALKAIELPAHGATDASALGPSARGLATDATRCTACRQCVCDPKLEDTDVRLNLDSTRTHFVVEATGQADAPEIILDAYVALLETVDAWIEAFREAFEGSNPSRATSTTTTTTASKN